ncbi:hypothetical protein ABQZ09_14375 [Xanthomonas sp. WHRI 6106]
MSRSGRADIAATPVRGAQEANMQRAAILLGIACALACAATRATQAAANQAEQRALPTAVADAALEAHYIDPSMAQRMRKALRQHAARGDYAAIGEPAALAQRLTDDLHAVPHDGQSWYHAVASGAA